MEHRESEKEYFLYILIYHSKEALQKWFGLLNAEDNVVKNQGVIPTTPLLCDKERSIVHTRRHGNKSMFWNPRNMPAEVCIKGNVISPFRISCNGDGDEIIHMIVVR